MLILINHCCGFSTFWLPVHLIFNVFVITMPIFVLWLLIWYWNHLCPHFSFDVFQILLSFCFCRILKMLCKSFCFTLSCEFFCWPCAFGSVWMYVRVSHSVVLCSWCVVLSVTLRYFSLWLSDRCSPLSPSICHLLSSHSRGVQVNAEELWNTKCMTKSVYNQRKHKGLLGTRDTLWIHSDKILENQCVAFARYGLSLIYFSGGVDWDELLSSALFETWFTEQR